MHIAQQHFNWCPQEDTTKHGVRKMVPEAMYNSNMVLGVCQEQQRAADIKLPCLSGLLKKPVSRSHMLYIC